MNRLLKISILANLLLAVLAVWLCAKFNRQTQPVEYGRADSAPAISSASNSPQPVQIPFRWSQIESDDYRTYIANLRRIGCPEKTVREIVMADIDDLYEARRQDLQRKLMDPASQARAGTSGRKDLETGLAQLRGEEFAVIRTVLGLPPAAVLVASDTTAPVSDTPTPTPKRRTRQTNDAPTPASLPLAFQPVDTSSLGLSDKQIAVINQLRDEFQVEIGGTNQDPDDPVYLKRWQEAQIRSDEMLSAVLGEQLQIQYEQLAAEAAKQQPAPPAP